MSTFDSIFYPTGEITTATLATVTSTAEIVLGNNRVFAITSSDDIRIKFGNSGMAAAAAGDFPVWASSYARYDTGSHQDRIRLFNPTGATITYWIQFLAR